MFKVKSISFQVSAMAVGVIAVAIAGLVWYVSTSTYTVAKDLGAQTAHQAANGAVTALEAYLNNASGMTASLASEKIIANGLVDGFPTERTQKRFEEVMSGYSDYWAMFIFDRDGIVRAGLNAKGTAMAGADRASRGYVKAILGGADTYITPSTLVSKSGGGVQIFGIAKAIKDDSGFLLGGVAVFPFWEKFTEAFIDPVRIGQDGYGFIFDAQGKIISHAVNKDLIQEDLSELEFVQQAMAVKDGDIVYDWKGRDKFMAVRSVPQTGWLVCMSVYEDDLAAGAISQRTILIEAGIVLVIVVAGLIVFMLRRMVFRPLASIEVYSGQVSAGDFNATLEGKYKYELAQVAGHITEMVGVLKEKLGFAQGVLNGIPTPCGIVGPDFNMIWANQQVCDLLEKTGTPDSYVGVASGEFYWNDPQRETLSDKAIKENTPKNIETEYVTPSGKNLHVDVSTTPFYDMDGKILGSTSFWYDLTLVRNQEKKVKAQNDKIENAADRANAIADQVVSASEELSGQIEESSRGAELQRERAAEAATAMEEMNATVLEVASNASAVAELADQSKDKAQGGADIVENMVGTIREVHTHATQLQTDMADLGKQAEGIGQIMTVITDIADQTNLLALNAAIEAARAGDAGRGFAVVADEVRKLAEKTMTATNEVGDAISSIQKSAQQNMANTEKATVAIDQSTEMADQSGQALQEIVTLVEQTADQVRSIATASEEQSATSEEISRATGEINQIAAETAGAMQQSADAVSDLARVAGDLKGIIDDMRSE